MKDNNSKKLFYLLIGISTINYIVILFVYPKLPETIPIHWGINGTIDGWGNKIIILGLALIPIVISTGMFFLPKIDPKKASYEKFSNIYCFFAIAMTFFMILILWLDIATALNILDFDKTDTIPRIICLILGTIFIILGNFAPRIKQNWYFGFRTPWALENKTNWQKTQRMSGIYYIILGIMLFLNGLLMNRIIFSISAIFVFVGLVYIYYYSYSLYKKEISNND